MKQKDTTTKLAKGMTSLTNNEQLQIDTHYIEHKYIFSYTQAICYI